MAETINGTGAGSEAASVDDSIRGAILAAQAEHEEEPSAPEPKAPAAKGAPDADAKTVEAPIAPAEGEAEPEAKPDKATKKAGDKEPVDPGAETEAKAEPTAEEKAADEKKAATAALTGKWSAKDKETFTKLPPEGQDLFLRRHKEMEGAFTKKTQEIAAFRKEYEPVQQLLAPHAEQMKQHGWTPHTLISAWANVETRLMKGEGPAVVAGVMKGYNINLADVAKAMGLKPPPPTNGAAEPARPNGEAPPAVAHAQTELSPDLQARVNALVADALKPFNDRVAADDRKRADDARVAANAAIEKVTTELEQFKTAQDDKGNLKHPHFEEVEDQMTLLAEAANAARKPVPSLEQLYEAAVMANPDLQKEVIAARVRAQRDTEAQAARAKAEKARKAASSVTGAPGSGQAPTAAARADLSLREQLEAAASDADG